MKNIVLAFFVAASAFTAASVAVVNHNSHSAPTSVMDIEQGLLAGTPPPPICPPICGSRPVYQTDKMGPRTPRTKKQKAVNPTSAKG